MLLKSFGFLMLGYAFGVVVADVRFWRLAARTRVFAVQFYDWEKIEFVSQNQTDAAESQQVD